MPTANSALLRIDHAALIADDDLIVRDILRSLLTEAGYTVVAATSGQEALTLAPYLNASVAILDYAMPNGDGVQTCEALRRLPGWQSVPILMLTGHRTDTTLQAARRAGVNGFVCKPFVPSELLQRVARLTGEAAPAQAREPMVWRRKSADDLEAAAQSPMPAALVPLGRQQVDHLVHQNTVLQVFRSMSHEEASIAEPDSGGLNDRSSPPPKILVAEDEEMTREIVSYILTQAGYTVDVAVNGSDALTAVDRNRYDLILMDIRMPALSGFAATRLIRSLPNRKGRTPIIAVTANAVKRFGQEARDAGMNGYLMKPINSVMLLDCVRRYLQPGAVPPVSDLRNKPPQPPGQASFQNEGALFAPGAMARFLDNLAASVEEILQSLQGWVTTEPTDIRRRLHNLAGAAGTLGCGALSEVARDLEAEPAPSDALRQRFAKTANATLAAVRQYRTQADSPRARHGLPGTIVPMG